MNINEMLAIDKAQKASTALNDAAQSVKKVADNLQGTQGPGEGTGTTQPGPAQASISVATMQDDVEAAEKAVAEAQAPSIIPIAGAKFVPFFLAVGLGAIFALLAWAAWSVTSATNTTELGGPAPVIVLALIGALFNPTSTKGSEDPNLPPDAWTVVTCIAALATGACAFAMCLSGHPASQLAFEVAAGGLGGLLTNASAFAVLQSLLPNAKSLFGLK